MILEGLNEQQKKAATTIDGAVIVFAGAGSGKTKTLTSRIAYMISECGINPFNILAITFTNKATKEMQERLKLLNITNFNKVTISTFHAWCCKILRKEIHHLGFRNDFQIMDEEDQLKILSDVLDKNGLERKKARSYQKMINHHKCFMSVPEDDNYYDIFQKYNDEIINLGLLDFEDLLLYVYKLFTQHKQILEKYQNFYKYILVDEFQDTNLAQYKIIRLLSMSSLNLFVVGDDDQSIYSFRGTNYENVNNFKNDFLNYKQFLLTKNYRSTQLILNCCNNLIKNNINREPKVMETDNPGSNDDVFCYCASDEKEEADFVSKKIIDLKYDNSNYAILYRSSVLLRNIELSLIKNNIPYKVYGGISYLKRKEVKDIISYFKLFINVNDFYCFKRVINTPPRGIGHLTVEKIDNVRRSNKYTIIEALENCTGISNSKKEEINKFLELISKYKKLLKTTSLTDIFDMLIEEIDYPKYLNEEYEKEEALDRLQNLYEFKSLLITEETNLSNEEILKEALDKAMLSEENTLENSLDSKVTVSTIHSVKGLEFDCVFLIGLEEDVFPNYGRLNNNFDLEEERRIAYVAMTRARKKLFLTYANKRLLYGQFFYNNPSRFLKEATDSLKRNVKTHDGYKVGDKVIHTVFKEGIILSISDGNGSIFFNELKSLKIIKLSTKALSKK